MKYLLIIIIFICCESVGFSEPPRAFQTQTAKIYTIHKSRRDFVRKPKRKYLKHRGVKRHIRHQVKKHEGPRR